MKSSHPYWAVIQICPHINLVRKDNVSHRNTDSWLSRLLIQVVWSYLPSFSVTANGAFTRVYGFVFTVLHVDRYVSKLAWILRVFSCPSAACQQETLTVKLISSDSTDVLHKQRDFSTVTASTYESLHIKHNVAVRELVSTTANTSKKQRASS